MNIHIEAILDYFTRLFNRFTVRIETIHDEPELVGIGVFGVPRSEMAWVRKAINDAEDDFFANFDLGLIPMIRSWETTAKHYPNLIAPWVCRPSSVMIIDNHLAEHSLEQFVSVSLRDKHGFSGAAPANLPSSDMLLAA